jgi:integrase
MDLVFATKEFKLHGMSYSGFPILLDSEMRDVEPVNDFLLYHLIQRGRIGSKKSWRTIAQHLYDYFGFLEAYRLKWDDVQRGEDHSVVAAYRDYSLKDCRLHRNTVRQRLGTVIRFYRYARHKQWITDLPFETEDVRVSKPDGFLAHVDASRGIMSSTDVMPRAHKALPKFLARDDIRALLSGLTNPTHKMMTRMGLQIGLRREEIATFPATYVVDPGRRERSQKLIKIYLDPNDGHGMATKGSTPREVFLSSQFMAQLWQYRIHERGRLAALHTEQCEPLFLTALGKPWALDGSGFEKVLRVAGARVGVTVWPHLLRHTYATYTLCGLQKEKNTFDPLVFLQKQLGHRSITTTMIYAHLVDQLIDDAVMAFDAEVTEWSRCDGG